MSAQGRIHLARAVDPQRPQGPQRPACGAVLGLGEALTSNGKLVSCGGCRWLLQPRRMLIEIDPAVALGPGQRRMIAAAHAAEAGNALVGDIGFRVGAVTLPLAEPSAPASSGVDLVGLRARARWIFLDRAFRVQGTDGVLAVALASAAGRLDGASTVELLLQRVYDEAIALQAQPHTEEISGWVCDRQRDVKLKPYDQGYNALTEEGKVSVRWYARHFVLFFILTGNPDYSAGQGPALMALAAEVVAGSAWQGDNYSKPTMLSLVRYIAGRLPAGATASRAWALREADIVGFHDPSAWEIVKTGVQQGAQQIEQGAKHAADAVEPPGGWGVGVLFLGAALGGFAIWTYARK